MAERGVDDDHDVVELPLGDEVTDRLVELAEARKRPSFGGDVRTVDDDGRLGW